MSATPPKTYALDEAIDPQVVYETCIAAGMPHEMWEHLDKRQADLVVRYGRAAVKTDMPMDKDTSKLNHTEVTATYHPTVISRFSESFGHLENASYYFTNDPNVPPFLFNDAESTLRYFNHALGSQFAHIREHRPKARPGRPRATSVEDAAAKLEKSQRYQVWLKECAEYRELVYAAKQRVRDAMAIAAEHRIALQDLEAVGAPKLYG